MSLVSDEIEFQRAYERLRAKDNEQPQPKVFIRGNPWLSPKKENVKILEVII